MLELENCDLETLQRLSAIDADALGRAIAVKLATTPVDDFVLDLVRFTQHLQVEDPQVRSLLSRALFQTARDIAERDRVTEETTLFAAIHMAAVFADKPEGLAPLVHFLSRGRASPGTQLAALQAIGDVARRGPLAVGPELHDLARAVDRSTNHFCQLDLLTIPEVSALAIAAVVASHALGLPGTNGRKDEFRHHPLLLRQLEEALTELVEEWSPDARRAAEEAAELPLPPRNRQAVLEWLRLPPHRQFHELQRDGGDQLLEWICAELRAQPRLQRGLPASPGDTKLLPYPKLYIGQEFTHPTTGHRWRVTDVGTRTFLAIDLTAVEEAHPGDPTWLNGPPYAVSEEPWDEYDAQALTDAEGIEWAEHGPRAALDTLIEKVQAFAKDWKAQEGCSSYRLDDILNALEGYLGPLP